MLQPYDRIRLFSYLIAATLIVSFAGASLVLVWQEAQITEHKDRNAAYHFATIRHAFKIKEDLYRLEHAILVNAVHNVPHVEGEVHEHSSLSVHAQQQTYTIRKELDSILRLQRAFGADRFRKTLEKIEAEYGELAALLTPDAGDVKQRDILTAVSALLLSASQLDRLHAIAHSEVDRSMERLVRRRATIVAPVAAAILLCGIIGLGYLMRRTRDALAGLEQAEVALQRFNEELEQRVEDRTGELRSAQEDLVRKERLAVVGQITATVSHELRNPLGAIRSASDAIRALVGDGDPQMNRAIALLERSQVRCDKVITELLDFTRVRELNLTNTRVDDWLGALLDEYQPAPDIGLRRELVSGVESAIDRDRLERALRNVLDNACHAMASPIGGEVVGSDHTLTVASRVSGDRLEISVVDSGSGIAPEVKAKVFEPLFSTKSYGVGLGLPMVRQIAEQHGGGVEIQSEVGRGTEVVLWIPQRAAEEEAAE
jgi:signal transduction histidine kinase